MALKGTQQGMGSIAVGDRKTPDVAWPNGVNFLSFTDQLELEFSLAEQLPENHYARKNLGYLLAMSRGAELIFDTDDDNAPMDAWARRGLQVEARVCSGTGWVNVYKWYSDSQIWPRGFPLEKLRATEPHPGLGELISCRAPIQQGLTNGSPDVDAVWRLTKGTEITFRDNGSVVLPTGAWCPFNSQSTWWFPEAYPLMYLPSFVSFRMTDIWRSFIAQRCLWVMGYGLVFHGPEMYQERNPHNLLRDFEQEIPGYLSNDKICRLLEELNLSGKPEDAGENLRLCYVALIKAGYVPAEEMALVEAWLKDVSVSAAVERASKGVEA